MTYNVQWLVADVGEHRAAGWRTAAELDAHYERVASVIARQAPHIVNLVEVTGRAGVLRLVELVNRRTRQDFQAYHVEMHDSQTGQDVAVLSRIPLDRARGEPLRHFYSRGDGERWRAPYQWQGRVEDTSVSKNAAYRVVLAGRCVAFLGLHLVARPNDPRRDAQREAQAEVAARILREEVAIDGCLPVVLGDLNDYDADVPDAEDRFSPTSGVLGRLKDYDRAKPGAELVNLARLLPKPDRYTSRWAGAPGGEARTMIDHVLIHDDLLPHVVRVTIPHTEAAGASDHWPVVVDFDFPEGQIADGRR